MELLPSFILSLSWEHKHLELPDMKLKVRLKPAIDESKFSLFNRGWSNFDPSVGRLVVQKSISRSTLL